MNHGYEVNMKHVGLSAQIADYISLKEKTKLETLKKQEEKRIKAVQDSAEEDAIKEEFEEKREALENQHIPENWLADAARRAGQIQMVTHALKYTHTDARGTSLYFPEGPTQPEGISLNTIINTGSLSKPEIDIVGNAAALDVAKLLQLEHEDKSLINYIEEGDDSPLQSFTTDQDQLNKMMEGFRKVLTLKELSSHKLAKQIYFPVRNGQYHLLSPLYSTTLANAVHKQIKDSRFSDEAKDARKAKYESKYSEMVSVNYPNTAVQHFGGANKQNVSQLNSMRGGKAFLLPCSPPVWQTMEKPPLGAETIFSRNHFGYRVRKELWLLRKYLESQIKKDSIKPVRDNRKEQIENLMDELIQYMAEIRGFPAGWSADPECKLPRSEQLWLDPGRADWDNDFKTEREKNDWQKQVAGRFSNWLNKRLESNKLAFSDVEYTEWKSLFSRALRLLKDGLEVFS